jgi:hypothetical protein
LAANGTIRPPRAQQYQLTDQDAKLGEQERERGEIRHRHLAALTDDLPQLREQSAQLGGQGLGRLGDDHEHRVAERAAALPQRVGNRAVSACGLVR